MKPPLSRKSSLPRERWPSSCLRARPAEMLDHPIRRKICEEIRRRPGIHFAEITRRIGTTHGNVSFHLSRLERAGYVYSKWIRGRRRLFGARSDAGLGPPAFVSQSQQRILELLRIAPGVPQNHIGEVLGVCSSTVTYHIRLLRLIGLVDTRREKRSKRCYLREM